MMEVSRIPEENPIDSMLHTDAIPSVWCSSCGIGIIVNTFLQSLRNMEIDLEKIFLISSGIGCTGKVDEYLKINSERTEGNPIDYAMRKATENPEKKIILFLNDADFIVSGIDELITAGKESANIAIIYINNHIYQQYLEHKSLFDTPFIKAANDNATPLNIPDFARYCGAAFIARWTCLHVKRLMWSIQDAIATKGLSVVEVISPCLIYYMSKGEAGEEIDRMRFYQENAVIKHHEPTENLNLREGSELIIGRFIMEEET